MRSGRQPEPEPEPEAFAAWPDEALPDEALRERRERRRAAARRARVLAQGGDRTDKPSEDPPSAGCPRWAAGRAPSAVGAADAFNLAHSAPATAALLSSLGAARAPGSWLAPERVAERAPAPAHYPLRKIDSDNVFSFDELPSPSAAAAQIQRVWRGWSGRKRWFDVEIKRLKGQLAANLAVVRELDVPPRLRQLCQHALQQNYDDPHGFCRHAGKLRRFTFVCVMELCKLNRDLLATLRLFRTRRKAAVRVQAAVRGHAVRRACRRRRLRRKPMEGWTAEQVASWLDGVRLCEDAALELTDTLRDERCAARGRRLWRERRSAHKLLVQVFAEHSIDGRLLSVLTEPLLKAVVKEAPRTVACIIAERDAALREQCCAGS